MYLSQHIKVMCLQISEEVDSRPISHVVKYSLLWIHAKFYGNFLENFKVVNNRRSTSKSTVDVSDVERYENTKIRTKYRRNWLTVV